jgi:hypothetical protein
MASTGDDKDRVVSNDPNPDPFTGEAGPHPVETGLGAAGGAVAGAAAGAMAGPAGVVGGSMIGGVIGGLAGKGAAESIDPTAEDAYWRENYKSRPYYDASSGEDFNVYQPAYRYGWESRSRYTDKTFDEVEPELERDWTSAKTHSHLSWEQAKHAARDAWDWIAHSISGRRDEPR